jgi:hypothetical protein
MTIDMKDYAGELDSPAAVEQQPSNSYIRNEQEYPVLPSDTKAPEAPVEARAESVVDQVPVQEESQALNFKALSESVERLKAEREAEKREHQLQLDMLRANLVQRNTQQDQPKPRKMFDGMEDGEIPNVGELRQAWNEREVAYNEKIEELQVASNYPDYAEVLTKHGKRLAETDPVFLQGLRGAENKALFAYQYAKREQRFQELEAQVSNNKAPNPLSTPSNNAQKIVDNARKPGTLAQAGGQSVLSKADYFETMSDAEFMKYAGKHLEGI